MYGAILGDIIGSPYEFDQNNIKTTDFELFSERSEFTDDSIMTLAVAEGLMNCGIDAEEDVMKKSIIEAMKKYGKRYPFAGYGANFSMWLDEEDPKPYRSFGNGSAMRVSAAAWLCQESLQKMLQIAAVTAEVSHNHPDINCLIHHLPLKVTQLFHQNRQQMFLGRIVKGDVACADAQLLGDGLDGGIGKTPFQEHPVRNTYHCHLYSVVHFLPSHLATSY